MIGLEKNNRVGTRLADGWHITGIGKRRNKDDSQGSDLSKWRVWMGPYTELAKGKLTLQLDREML